MIYAMLLPLILKPLLIEILNAKSPRRENSIVLFLCNSAFGKTAQILQGGNWINSESSMAVGVVYFLLSS